MLVTRDAGVADHARKLAAQARDPAPHYEHSEVGFNYRLSNVLAAIGLGQLQRLDARIAARRSNFDYYFETLQKLPGIQFMPEADWGRHTRWLTTLTIDPAEFGATREDVRLALEAHNIESRPLWKPMHLQPVFNELEVAGGSVCATLFDKGLCLPSGSQMTVDDLQRVTAIIADCHAGGVGS
jgi:pyridoxal phosphate-dependent aminotransferase EpsN